MRLTKEEKCIPGKRRRLFLEYHHKCNDNEHFCRMCLSSHIKEEPCKMRFKKLIPKSQGSKICYISYAMVSSNFQVDCYECYTTKKICSLHLGLRAMPSNDICNVIHTLRDVRLMLQI